VCFKFFNVLYFFGQKNIHIQQVHLSDTFCGYFFSASWLALGRPVRLKAAAFSGAAASRSPLWTFLSPRLCGHAVSLPPGLLTARQVTSSMEQGTL
jgi:hypothetical protein